MPTWVIVYLIALLLLTVFTVRDNFSTKRKRYLIQSFAEILVFLFISILTIGYFDSDFGNLLRLFPIPMLAYIFLYELYSLNADFRIAEEDSTISAKQLIGLKAFALLFFFLFIVPGFSFGANLLLRNW
jgi:hypothetical protein